jgi:hypothetical protein
MSRALLAVLVFLLPVPALAKPHDVFPVSCDVMWTAVKDTLNNPNDYRILSISDEGMRASFLVLGSLKPFTDTIDLAPAEGGCAMKLKMVQIGSDNSDERVFRKQLGKDLAKLQSARPAKPAEKPSGQ